MCVCLRVVYHVYTERTVSRVHYTECSKTGKENIIFTYEKGDEGFNLPEGNLALCSEKKKIYQKVLVWQPVISFNRINFNELSNNIGNWRGEKKKLPNEIKRELLSFSQESEKNIQETNFIA